MSDYNFTNEEFQKIGDYLVAELAARENGPISESFAKTVIAKQNILTESEEYVLLSENVTTDYYKYHGYGVTVKRDQFEQVYTHPDEYPSPQSILWALGFPEEILRRPNDSLRTIVGSGNSPRKSSLLGWYNRNSSPVHELVPLQKRKATYSRAAQLAAEKQGNDVPQEKVEPTLSQIDGGKRNVNNRTSKVVDNINQQDIFAGEFYNNLTRIPRRNWNHWLKFWDKRMGAVEPNKKNRLGRLIGRTWGKTFLLGYQVDRTVVYEVWYNSLDSSFSVYDMHGVEMGNPTPTLQEAIRDLVHVIAQMSDTDKKNFGSGRTGADLAASLQRTLGNVMDQDVGVMKREQDLRTKEIIKQGEDEAEEYQKDQKRNQKQGDKNHRRRVINRAKNMKAKRGERHENEFQQMQQQVRSNVASKIKRDIEHAKEERRNAATEQGMAYWTSRIEELNKQLAGEQGNDQKASGEGGMPTATKSQKTLNKQEEDKVRQYDVSRAVKSGQEIMNRLQADIANREIDLKIEQSRQEMERLKRDINAAWTNSEVSEPEDLEPIDPKYGIAPTTVGINPDGSLNPQYRRLANELEKNYRAYEEEINKLQSFKKKNAKDAGKKKKKRGLGDMPWQTPKQRGGLNEASDNPFADLLYGSNEPDDQVSSSNPLYNEPEIPLPQHDFQDRRMDAKAKQVKQQAEQSPYNKTLLLGDITGSLKSYSETKIKKSSLKNTVGNWVRDTLAPTRRKAAQSVSPGFWSRAKMFFAGSTFRADFIIGWSLADRLNFEIWYVTEVDPNDSSKLISSFYVYDVNARLIVRKYLPYYRIALSTVSAKLGVA